jgi:hypothetical protein
MRQWPVIIGIVCAGFVLAWFVNPPYSFALENNLAYRDYVLLHKRAAGLVAAHFADRRVLTAWPATDELSHPYLGYTKTAVPVVPLEDFSAPQLLAAARDTSQFDLALLFSTKYEPVHDVFGGFALWQRWQMRFFGYHQDLPPEMAAQILGGRIIFRESRNGQWVALVAIERAENTHVSDPLATRSVNRSEAQGSLATERSPVALPPSDAALPLPSHSGSGAAPTRCRCG